MKRSWRTAAVLTGCVCMILSMLAACDILNGTVAPTGESYGGGEVMSLEQPTQPQQTASPVRIEDIRWSVGEGVADGERCVLMQLTNDSPYTIVSFKLEFKERSGLTDEQKEQFRSGIEEQLWDSSEFAEDYAWLRDKPLSMNSETGRLLHTGESVTGVYCYYYDLLFDVRHPEHYDMVAPDIATIRYIDGSEVRTEYYDFASGTYSDERSSEPVQSWTDKPIGSVIPKPEAEYLECYTLDYEEWMSFCAHGWSMEQFNAYVEQCKQAGFKLDSMEYEGIYDADSASGYSINMFYNKNDGIAEVAVKLEQPDE